MEATYLRRPWQHSPGWTTRDQRPCPVAASSQDQVASGAGPVRQPARAPRLRWQLCGKVETGRWLSMQSAWRDRARRWERGVLVGVAFYIWDQGGPAEVTLKQSSAMGGG